MMFRGLNSKSFSVGGSVRDELLGLTPKDRDFVVECTEEEFRLHFPDVPMVGKSFPVFLVEGHEVALTRTERSLGTPGRGDFELTAVGVPIGEDLGRRDFTICSMARSHSTGELIDPHGGSEDLRAGLIRTVNEKAFVEDATRLLRGARFAARFGFEIEAHTLELMRVSAANIHSVVPEQVHEELEKMYAQAQRPSVFFQVLADTGVLAELFPILEALRHVPAGPAGHHGDDTAFDHTMKAVDRAKDKGYPFRVFLAALFHDVGKGTTKPEILPHHYAHEFRGHRMLVEFLATQKFRAHENKLILEVAREHMVVHFLPKMKAIKLVRFFRKVRQTVDEYLMACDCDHPLDESRLEVVARLKEAFATAVVEIPASVKDKGEFAERVFTRRYMELI
jgi:tRNA nucleotidyltransferase (CCA-adding enzyme)